METRESTRSKRNWFTLGSDYSGRVLVRKERGEDQQVDERRELDKELTNKRNKFTFNGDGGILG